MGIGALCRILCPMGFKLTVIGNVSWFSLKDPRANRETWWFLRYDCKTRNIQIYEKYFEGDSISCSIDYINFDLAQMARNHLKSYKDYCLDYKLEYMKEDFI